MLRAPHPTQAKGEKKRSKGEDKRRRDSVRTQGDAVEDQRSKKRTSNPARGQEEQHVEATEEEEDAKPNCMRGTRRGTGRQTGRRRRGERQTTRRQSGHP